MTSLSSHAWLVPAILVTAVAVAHSRLPVPEGSRGTIDFRYPDHIVEPLVPCPTNGSFPHPNDCRWFYRCYDPYGIKFYWRSYFECAPGTVFSDALDHCVHPGPTDYECVPGLPETPSAAVTPAPCRESYESCRQENVCPSAQLGTAFVATVEICETSLMTCGTDIPKSICGLDEVFDTTNQRCISRSDICRVNDPRPEGFPVVCSDQLSECRDYHVCKGSATPVVHRLCQINQFCEHSDGYSSTNSLCQQGQLFDAFLNKCVPMIKSEEICAGTPPYGDPKICTDESEKCSVFQGCSSRESVVKCSSYFTCSDTRSASCSFLQVFSPRYSACLPRLYSRDAVPAGGLYSPCVVTGLEAPPKPSLPSPAGDVSCTRLGEIPLVSNDPALQCAETPQCPAGVIRLPVPRSVLCQHYYVCQQNFLRQSVLTPQLMRCSEGQLFSFDSLTCVNNEPCPTTEVEVSTPVEVTPITEAATQAPVETTSYSSLATSIPINVQVKCSSPGEIPALTGQAKKINCQDIVLCNEGTSTYIGIVNLCSKFYRCSLDKTTKQLTASVESCPNPADYYDIKALECVPEPTNRCPFGVARTILEAFNQLTPSQRDLHTVSSSSPQIRGSSAQPYIPAPMSSPYQQAGVGGNSLSGYQTPQAGQGQFNQASQGQFNQAGQGQFNQAGQRQFNQAGQGQFNQAGQGQFNQAGPGQFNQAGQGQFNQAGPGQFNQAGQGQFNQARPGQFGNTRNTFTQQYNPFLQPGNNL